MRHVTIRQLEIFAEAARLLSFARVAERLHLTPAAVSFQIRQIEQRAGCALFERIGKTARLTDAGLALETYAGLVLQAMGDADQAMLGLKRQGGGRATIGLVTTATYVVPHILARFQAEDPHVAIRLKDGNRAQMIGMVLDGEVDLAVMGQPPEGTGLVAEPFADHPSVVIAAPGHPLAGRRLMPADLADQPFVMREDGSGTRGLMARVFSGAGFEPRVGMVSSSNETIKQAVMAGMGLALISRHTIGMELGLGRLTMLDIAGFPLMRQWFVVHRRSKPQLPVHLRLRDFLGRHGAAIIDDLEASHAMGLPTPRGRSRAVQVTNDA